MITDESLLSKAKKQIEAKLGWGDSHDWANQDFLDLSKKIQDELNIPISHVTLKRIWGKVKYESLPNTFTLNTLVQFIGYESWRDFKIKNDTNGSALQQKQRETNRVRLTLFKPFVIIILGALVAAGCFFAFRVLTKQKVDTHDYSLAAKKTLAKGVPNSVIFDYDATRAPGDSVIIQQSWDTMHRTTVPKNQHQRSLIYYIPGYYEAKLIVEDKIVKERGILIESDGWLTAIESMPMPVYFKKEDVMHDGMMSLAANMIEAKHINLTPQAPMISYVYAQDFGSIYSDNFVFETAVRNDYKEGSAVCQNTSIYILCEGTAVHIPLCTKGCVSNAEFFFTAFMAPGKQADLSNFGVDFTDFAHVKVEASHGKAHIYINDRLAYTVDHDILKSKIIGFDYMFQGTGSVDYVKLTNGNVKFEENF